MSQKIDFNRFHDTVAGKVKGQARVMDAGLLIAALNQLADQVATLQNSKTVVTGVSAVPAGAIPGRTGSGTTTVVAPTGPSTQNSTSILTVNVSRTTFPVGSLVYYAKGHLMLADCTTMVGDNGAVANYYVVSQQQTGGSVTMTLAPIGASVFLRLRSGRGTNDAGILYLDRDGKVTDDEEDIQTYDADGISHSVGDAKILQIVGFSQELSGPPPASGGFIRALFFPYKPEYIAS